MGVQQQETQLDRIEAKLDRVLSIVDAALKVAMPRIPAAARATALQLMAKTRGEE